MMSALLACQDCPRLAAFFADIREKYPNYHARPVLPFGDAGARLLIVGLAPGMHGANATGRPFTGDHAGILLYETLYKLGFSNQAKAVAADDGLVLYNCRISNAVKCLPPQNKPVTAEIKQCNHYLQAELAGLATGSVVLSLGGIAHQSVLRALGLKLSAHPFGHGVEYEANGLQLLSSYHCSRYNTQTKRLSAAMFEQVFERAKALLE